MQFEIHSNIQRGFLNTMKSTINIKIKAPIPNINISFFTNVIVSSQSLIRLPDVFLSH